MSAAVLVIALALTQAPTPPDSLEQERVFGAVGAKLDSLLTSYGQGGFAGTVLVVRDRRIVLLKSYGLADVERGVRNSPATRYEMNSLTKMFTAASILQLARAGRLRLDDRVERHLGAFPAGKRDVTIEQLASHTSGLVVAGTNLAGDTRDAFVADMKRTPREAPAGTQYRYTNAGYSLLAAIVEHASGQHYEAYVREHIFAPAGMRTAVFRDEMPPRDSLFARAHVGSPNPYVWGTRGAGGAWTTVGDIYRWVVAVEDSVVIRDPQRMLLLSPPRPPSLEAYGWHVNAATDSTRARIDKGGGSADFASQLLYYPTERVVIVWATNNLRQRWRQTLNRALADIVFTGSTRALPPQER
jgi:CubicO group peptidase (beta-lactamase class C family)